ncbi:MAG: hypothetical protein WAL75_19780 [Terracidiphilus sp.]
MDLLGSVNAESGLLLVADGALLACWTGAEGPDYDRACGIFDRNTGIDGTEIDIGNGKAILWKMKGAGTASIFKLAAGRFSITRVWPHDPRDASIPRLIADRPAERMVRLGNVSVESGNLTVLWAAEKGIGMELAPNVAAGYPRADLSIDTAGFIVRVQPTSFACFHDQVEIPSGIGIRLHLFAQ